jgi:S-DNA-T family DNA segregation ATPase FtsK/SpoIIIE
MSYRNPYRRYRRRMRRFGRNRYGEYPMLLIGPDEPLSMIAAAAFARWAYRHRSAFWPFVITIAAFATAANLHTHHARYWIIVAVLTFQVTVTLAIPHRLVWTKPAGRITTGLISRLWRVCGIERPEERIYAATVVAMTGGWLAAAIANGPTAKPLPKIALIATVILGIPWWAHRRRRAKVRAEHTIQRWPGIAENVGLPGSRIASIVVDVWGWTARVILRKGTTADEAINKLPSIESGLGLRPGSARAIPDPDKANRFTLRVIETDPHASPIPWPGPTVTSITQAIELGLLEDGQPVKVLLLRRNALVGGIIDSGKSGILNVILGNLAACHDVVIWGIDLKGGMELGPWESCLERLATTPREAHELFQGAIRELNDRARRKAREGKRLWEPTPDEPALIVVVDEYAELPDEAQDYADSIARRGRAVAVNLVAATQRPTQKVMGSNTVRSQMDVRVCLRVRERRDVDLILGQGSFNSGWQTHHFSQPGLFLLSAREHTVPQRARGYLVTDDHVSSYAAAYTQHRPRLRVPNGAPNGPQSPQTPKQGPARDDDQVGSETALWDALSGAGPEGISVTELVTACGMGRRWVYYRLREHAAAGRAVQVRRGWWRASPPGDGQPPPRPTPGRPPNRPPRR